MAPRQSWRCQFTNLKSGQVPDLIHEVVVSDSVVEIEGARAELQGQLQQAVEMLHEPLGLRPGPAASLRVRLNSFFSPRQ